MALVLRSDLVAHATAQPPEPGGVTGAAGAVPRQSPPATEPAQPPGQSPPQQSGAQPPGPHLPGAEAAAVPSRPASAGAVLAAAGLVVLGAVVAYVLDRSGIKAAPFKIGNQTSAYAALAVFAAVLERVLEAFAQWLPGGQQVKAEFEQLVAAVANGNPSVTVADVANAKARLDHSTANRTVVIWGLASSVATVVAMLTDFELLHTIAGSGWNPNAIPYWVDAVVTGLVVGTGTKPLHDLITRAQNARTALAGR
ncbi:MAG: hypothetical protein J2P15_08175 [Micromonosporaceae bacterium]|nr:hypothetical protein [Micromonosporaceae bacterium]